MAIRWQWDECIGEIETEKQDKAKIRIYQGNALAIFLNEWKSKAGEDLWTMHYFFADKRHFENCRKDKEWNYAEGWKKIILWKVPTDFWPILKDLTKRGVEIVIRAKEHSEQK